MRIASIYLPSFPLQVHVRRAPHLAGRAFAVSSPGPHPVVIACSRAAWDLGVRAGMSTIKANAVAPELIVVGGDDSVCRRAAEALAETLLAVGATVEVPAGSHGAASGQSILVRVPPGVRGASFGHKLLTLVSRHGYRARAGIADDRFTAQIAAFVGDRNVAVDPTGHHPFDQCCVVVPRGGAAAYLAPMPIALLPLEDEMRHPLESLGILTIGDFAALPRPSIARRRRLAAASQDLHALATGDGPSTLDEMVPRGLVAETLELEHTLSDPEPLSFLLRPLIDRACDRVAGRGNAVDELTLRLHGGPTASADACFREAVHRPKSATISGRALLDLVREGFQRKPLGFAVAAMDVVVTREAALDQDRAAPAECPAATGEFRLEPVIPRERGDHRRTRRGKNRRRHRRPDHRISNSTD